MELMLKATTYDRVKDVRDEMQDDLDRKLTMEDTINRLIDEYEKSKRTTKKKRGRR